MNTQLDSQPRPPTAFTLIELLVVIAIIGVLAGLMLPVGGRIKQTAQRNKARAELEQIAFAIETYKEKLGHYPPDAPNSPNRPRINPLFFELLGTKLRALYQRKKGRDLYDLWAALADLDVDAGGIVECFQRYVASDGAAVTRAMFEANLSEKVASAAFRSDVLPLLRDGDVYDVDAAGDLVLDRLVSRLPGEPWRGRG